MADYSTPGVQHVLLFSTRAHPDRAARVHAVSCPLVAAAKRSRATKVLDADDETIADLNDREFPVKFCKCTR